LEAEAEAPETNSFLVKAEVPGNMSLMLPLCFSVNIQILPQLDSTCQSKSKEEFSFAYCSFSILFWF
jgi:hypothetical protein